MTSDEVVEHLARLEELYGSRGTFVLNSNTVLQQVLTCMGITHDDLRTRSLQELSEEVELRMTEACAIYLRAKQISMHYEIRARKVAQDVKVYGNLLLSSKQTLQSAATVAPSVDVALDSEADEDASKWNNTFQIIQYMLDVCVNNRFYKRKVRLLDVAIPARCCHVLSLYICL